MSKSTPKFVCCLLKTKAHHHICFWDILSVDHVGVSNAQLVKEQDPLAARYNERSVAEQNSLGMLADQR